MTRVIHQSQDTYFDDETINAQNFWLNGYDLERATGWLWKTEGLCKGEVCMPIPRNTESSLICGDRIDALGLWRYAGWPVVYNQSRDILVLGEDASHIASALTSMEAPDFELPDADERMHRLSDYRGSKVFMVTWASWCGCRNDLALWKSLHEANKIHRFTVLAIALDREEAARPWIDAASPSFPCLIDRNHLTAELYNLVNVPQAVWIDESGKIVRPPETAGASDNFRSMNRQDFSMTESQRKAGLHNKTAYLEAVSDWAINGSNSRFTLNKAAFQAHLNVPTETIAEAHAHFRMGQALLIDGQDELAQTEFNEATRLHPASWAMWRQVAEKAASGLAVGEEFWQRVDALADRHYYAPMTIPL